MYSAYKQQSNILEEFRIKAHLRSYVKDPFIIDKGLLYAAVQELKKIPYQSKDPANIVAKELVIESYRLGFYKRAELTTTGNDLVLLKKKRKQKLKSSGKRLKRLLTSHNFIEAV